MEFMSTLLLHQDNNKKIDMMFFYAYFVHIVWLNWAKQMQGTMRWN